LRTLPASSALVFDRELRYMVAGGQALEQEGVAPAELEGRPAVEVLLGRRWETYEPLYRAALNGENRALEVWSEDDTRCYQVEVAPLRGPSGDVVGGVAVSRDVTRRKHAEEARRHAQERFELVFEQAPIGMALLTPEGRWVRVNHALLDISGYSAEELLAKTLEEVTHPDDLAADLEHIRELLAGEIREYQMEKRFFHARGHVICTLLTVSLVRDRQGHPLHFIAQIQDVTERKLMEERLRQLAEHDSLTGLNNRRTFERGLALTVARCRRYGELAALLVLDVDGFRLVNETYGHRAGDELLKALAAELTRRLRGTDTVARIGGDELAVLLPGTDGAAAGKVAATLEEAVAGCGVQADGRRIATTACVGVAAIDRDSAGAEAVLLEAERGLHAAKGARRRVDG
ncbi:MAG TPA: PAS domain S-box protein, partial [Solirubrobacteraceae bacterium]|nr:PAS domain S-box protein [Solirubrobacteraceae bacterium]